MASIQYDPESILNGFTEEVLKEMAKKLKRRPGVTKHEMIQEILSPKGKAEEPVKVWQVINRQLRKDMEVYTDEALKALASEEIPIYEQFKVGYMLTLSPEPEIRAIGAETYHRAEEVEVQERSSDKDQDEKSIEDRRNQVVQADQADHIDQDVTKKIARQHKNEVQEKNNTGNNKTIGIIDKKRHRATHADTTTGEYEFQKKIRLLENKLRKANIETMRYKEQSEKLKKDLAELRTQGVREKEETGKYRNKVKELEIELTQKEYEFETLKQKLEQKFKQKPEQKYVQDKQAASTRRKGQPAYIEPPHEMEKEKQKNVIDFGTFHGRRALIFAERDQDVEERLNALGIIPIWAMEIDWNWPRRRMSTCEIILYQMNDALIEKLDEIRDMARGLNIPFNELKYLLGGST